MPESEAPLWFVATCDLAAQVRGRAAPASRGEEVLASGVGWVPADLALTAFGGIAEDNVFGSAGDLRLLPDPETAVDLPSGDGLPALRVYVADQVQTDGSPWECCPRGFLRDALSRLRDDHGLTVLASFEHEFVLRGTPDSPPFSLERARGAEPFGTDLVSLLERIGLAPETWLPEYGAGQFEITLRPAGGLAAADRAVLLREVVRDLARRRGLAATFAPILDPAGVGSGVHVHLSLRDADGRPVLHDPARPGGLSELGARFAAGIVAHAGAVCALTAASPVSYLRLTPHRWSAGGAFVGERDREALLRLCPAATIGGGDPASALNLEFRAVDATANPWLALGAIVRAGMEGLAGAHGEAPVVPEGTAPTPGEIPSLPRDLPAALAALEADAASRAWLAPDLLATYLSVKRAEVAALRGLPDEERCRRIADVF